MPLPDFDRYLASYLQREIILQKIKIRKNKIKVSDRLYSSLSF